MGALPLLPQSTLRLLDLKWIELTQGVWSSGKAERWQAEQLAEARFDQVAAEYFALWEAGRGQTEVFQTWLKSIEELVVSEVGRFWQTLKIPGRRYATYPTSIYGVLSRAVAEWSQRAAKSEIALRLTAAPLEPVLRYESSITEAEQGSVAINSPQVNGALEGKHPNRAEWERIVDKYAKARSGDRLTQAMLSEEAGYKAKSFTEVKAWLNGNPRTESARANISEALRRIEQEIDKL